MANNADKLRNKIESQQRAFVEHGFECDVHFLSYSILNPISWIALLQISKEAKKYDCIYFRYQSFILFLLVLFPRYKKQKLILEIPTPINIARHELSLSQKNYLIKKIYPIVLYLILDLVLKKVDLIIEYAQEENKTVLKYSNKILLLQNGVESLDFFGIKNETAFLNNSKSSIRRFIDEQILHVLMVANLQSHHGLEFFLVGLKHYLSSSYKVKVFLTVVSGESYELNFCENLVKELNIQDNVRFIPQTERNLLKQIYANSNLAVSGFGSFKKHIKDGSALKVREALMFGIPVIVDYFDYGVSNTDFALNLKSTDTLVDIFKVVAFYEELVKKYSDDLPWQIHDFSMKNLLWRIQMQPLINKISQ